MISNVLFITIDSLRYDRVFGVNHTALTPNLNSIIKDGSVFSQVISTSDATGTSLGSIFSGCFPFKTGISHFNYDDSVPMFYDVLKENDYFLCSCVPDVSFFSKLTSEFDKKYLYTYDKREDWLQLGGGIGDMIVNDLKFLKQKTPWFYFIHLMDLHAPFKLPLEFNFSKFGSDRYDQMISYIDTWLGKFFSEINFGNTMIIISADHGDYIPTYDIEPEINKNLKKLLQKGKKIVPVLEPLGIKIFEKTKSVNKEHKLKQLEKILSTKDLRSLGTRGTNNLYDELLLIPLIFYGKNVPKSKIITNLVRQVDIFPTILDFLSIKSSLKDIHGQSLFPLLKDQKIKEICAYIETGSRNPKELGKLIGIRTSKYKFLKYRDSDESDVILYDLENDPDEAYDISNNYPEICLEMNNMLLELQKNSSRYSKKSSQKYEKEIEDELRKLGYL